MYAGCRCGKLTWTCLVWAERSTSDENRYGHNKTILIADDISELLDSLKTTYVPGCDGVISEHMNNMVNQMLCLMFSSLYNGYFSVQNDHTVII